LASHAQDDGFREIQLSGKQLVFLFMAATVVSVVIFLTGVLVGRNVRAERAAVASDAAAAPIEPPLPPAATAPAMPAGSDPTKAAPPPSGDEGLTSFKDLEQSNPPKPDIGPEKGSMKTPPAQQAAAEAPPVPTVVGNRSAPASAAEKAPVEKQAPGEKAAPAVRTSPPAASAAPAPAEGEYTVQVAALNARAEADTIAKRLGAKGYQAYVVAPGNGAVMFRVRVGRFKTLREAQVVAARLQKEEQFKPWITH
jgi:cell division septation protein DedD